MVGFGAERKGEERGENGIFTESGWNRAIFYIGSHHETWDIGFFFWNNFVILTIFLDRFC